MVANVNIFSKHNKSTKNEQDGSETFRMVSEMLLGAELTVDVRFPISGRPKT